MDIESEWCRVDLWWKEKRQKKMVGRKHDEGKKKKKKKKINELIITKEIAHFFHGYFRQKFKIKSVFILMVNFSVIKYIKQGV